MLVGRVSAVPIARPLRRSVVDTTPRARGPRQVVGWLDSEIPEIKKEIRGRLGKALSKEFCEGKILPQLTNSYL